MTVHGHLRSDSIVGLQACKTAFNRDRTDIRDGDKFRLRVGMKRLAGSTCASSAAADECQLDRVVLARVDAWDGEAREGAHGGDAAGVLEEGATGRAGFGLSHGEGPFAWLGWRSAVRVGHGGIAEGGKKRGPRALRPQRG